MFGAKSAESSSQNGFRYTAFEKAFGPSSTVRNPRVSMQVACRRVKQRCNNTIYSSVCIRGKDVARLALPIANFAIGATNFSLAKLF